MTKAENEENPLILILDGLTDPHNLGSILRTADATNVTGIIIPKHRSVGVTPVVSKTSTGAVEHVPIARVTNLSQTLDTLKDKDFWIFGTDMNGTPPMKKHSILLVDGYNMIAFWKDTRQLFKSNRLEEAREVLLRKLNHYAHFEHIDIICVFDAQYVPGVRQRYDQYKISVIFTEEDETADSYIERAAAELNQSVLNLVSVATSDLNEQWTIFSQGALRVSARELEQRVATVKSDLDKMSSQIDLSTPKLRPWNDEQLGKLKDFLDGM